MSREHTSPNSSVTELPYAKNLASGGIPRKTTSCLTFSRGWLKRVALETTEIAEKGFYVNRKGETVSVEEDLRKAYEGSVHYHSTHEFSAPTTPGKLKTKFIVAFGSSLQVAAYLREMDASSHIGILNSASSKTPSKFLRGTISQEEDICRASLLCHCLQQFDHKPHHFYYINNKEKYMNNASACAIFSPLVPVIRQDLWQGKLLDKYDLCSFVSIPAVNAFVVGRQEHEHNIPKAQAPGALEAGVPHENMTLWESMYDRIFRALCIFKEHGCLHIVLCAFGCGVHGNNPETVAKIFHEILYTRMQNHFQTVAFAIQPSRQGNYKAFVNVFPEATSFSALSRSIVL